MKKLIIFILLIAVLIGGFLYFRGRTTIESIVKRQFKIETGLNLSFDNWEIRDNLLKASKPKISGDSLVEGGLISADTVQIDFDISEIYSRKLTIKEVLVDGLEIDSPSAESSFFKLIEAAIKEDPNPLIRTKLNILRGQNFKDSKLKFGAAVAELKPNNIELNFSEKTKPLIKAESPLEISLELPKVLSKLSRIVGDVSVSGELITPEISSHLKFKDSDLLELVAGLYQGVLTVRPVFQAVTNGGQNAIARGELQLRNLKLFANDFTIQGLPLGNLNPVFTHSQNQILARGELNLLNYSGDLWGKVEIRNIESLPIALKDLKLELGVSNREVAIKEGSFRGDAGAIDLVGGYNLELNKLFGQLKTKELLVKAPDIRARVPRGIQLTSQIDFTGNLNEPHLSGPLEVEFFKVGIKGEGFVEADLKSQLDLTFNRKNLILSKGSWKIKPLSIETQGREIKTLAPVPIEIANGELSLSQTEVLIGDKKIKIGGKLSRDGYNFSALGNAEILSLLGRKERIDDISGDIGVKLNLLGPLDAPQIAGEVNLTGGGFSIPLAGDRFHVEEISGRATFDDRKLILEDFQNSSGDARFSISGEIDDFLSEERSGSITAKFQQVVIQPDPNLALYLHADSKLTLLPNELPSLIGKIVIDDALYEQRSNLQELVKKLLGLLVRGSNTATSRQVTSPLRVEISVSADRSMVIDTDIFQGELSSDFRISANPQSITIDGSLYGDSGELRLSRNRFDVSFIKVGFRNQELGSLPEFELRADGELGPRGSAEQVQLKVAGMLPAPDIQLSSESARSQKELLAELGLGVDKLSVFSNQSRSSPSLLSAINPFSGAGLKDRVGDLTGGASVQVESGYSADTGTFAPRLLFEQPLPLTFRLVGQSELSQFNRNEINLEYPLTDQTNIFTGWKNAPTTRNPESLSGSTGFGIHYRERFPGTYVLPRDLLIENLEWILGISDDESMFNKVAPP